MNELYSNDLNAFFNPLAEYKEPPSYKWLHENTSLMQAEVAISNEIEDKLARDIVKDNIARQLARLLLDKNLILFHERVGSEDYTNIVGSIRMIKPDAKL